MAFAAGAVAVKAGRRCVGDEIWRKLICLIIRLLHPAVKINLDQQMLN